MTAYYNEIEPQKAAWLRELIKCGLIAPGDVDERSIEDVKAADLLGYTQCHFFAGIGAWSYALRCAGWADERPVWTGSCPCPSFSAAGKGAGFSDPRHLWPDWARLIRELSPAVVFGEQVSAAIGHGWLDLVQTDLEAQEYAVGKAVLGACSVGAPHIRQRLYFMAVSEHAQRRPEREEYRDTHGRDGFGGRGDALGMADADRTRLKAFRNGAIGTRAGGETGLHGAVDGMADADGRITGDPGVQRSGQHGLFAPDSGAGVVAQSMRPTSERGAGSVSGPQAQSGSEGIGDGNLLERSANGSQDGRALPLNGFWRDADWLLCRDGKWRPVESGTFPLVTGAPARVGRLRGYGDAICAPVAAEFIRCAKSVLEFT